MTKPSPNLALIAVALLGCGTPRGDATGDEATKRDRSAPAPEPAPEPIQRYPTTLRWVIGSEDHDLAVLEQLHTELVTRTQQLAGVELDQTCAPHSHVVIELDPTRLRVLGLDLEHVEAALRKSLTGVEAKLETLRDTALPGSTSGPFTITLGELAGLRYGFGEPTCVAATATGIAAAATVRLQDEQADTAMAALLDSFSSELPPSLSLTVLGPRHAVVDISLAADVSTEQGAQLLGRRLAKLPGTWLVEVGLAGDPCTAGMRARLSIEDLKMPVPDVIDRLRREPKLVVAEQPDDPAVQRVWLFDDDAQRVEAIASKLRAMPGVAQVVVELVRPAAGLQVQPNPELLAAHGLTPEQLSRQLTLVTDGVELGHVDAHGRAVSLILRLGEHDATDFEQLRTVSIHAGDQDVPLGELAALSFGPAPTGACAHDSRRGARLMVRLDDPAAWPQQRPRIEAQVPAGTWAWDT